MSIKEKKHALTDEMTSAKVIVHSEEVFVKKIDEEPVKADIQTLPDNIQKALDSIPDIQIKKVEAIKKQIKDGTYEISTEKLEKVADALIENTDISIGLFNK